MNARKQYLEELRKEYQSSDEKGRSRLLDEAEKRMRYNRKYLIRVLNQTAQPERRARRRKRKAEYGAALSRALITVWDMFEQPCGQRMAPIVAEQVEPIRRLGELR